MIMPPPWRYTTALLPPFSLLAGSEYHRTEISASSWETIVKSWRLIAS
jgi:hypothetical protein